VCAPHAAREYNRFKGVEQNANDDGYSGNERGDVHC
jgi:hypothetical protein